MRAAVFILAASLLAAACNGGALPTPTPFPTPTTVPTATATPTPTLTPTPTPPAGLTPTPTPPAGLTLTLSSADGAVGETVELELVLWMAVGVSGFEVSVRVKDPTIARIADVPLRGLTLVAPKPPAPEVRIRKVDLFGLMDSPHVVLATIEVEMLAAGTTVIAVEVLKIDDNDGAGLYPAVVGGVVTVR